MSSVLSFWHRERHQPGKNPTLSVFLLGDFSVTYGYENLKHGHSASGIASYGALGHMPLSTSNNFILVHLNLTANYPSMCSLPAE